ncbi:hypothetical protein DL764_001622 [Monosporascus ibericus]|uniref:Secreted protein n=1 Tax=Monosporascus ibericus TaxID=155417 RepID=A0A4Q4TNN9_9PEZI|nr:hypothetical protein DL764_001622 [Monosporascus ibericus]
MWLSFMHQLAFWLDGLLTLYLPLPADRPAPLNQGLSSPSGRRTLRYRPVHGSGGDRSSKKENTGFDGVRWSFSFGVRFREREVSPVTPVIHAGRESGYLYFGLVGPRTVGRRARK